MNQIVPVLLALVVVPGTAPAVTQEVPGARGIWAPDIAHLRGRYHLYYSVSTFGKNRSVIGLATNKTLDPTSPDYRWVDEGKAVGSTPEDDWNAIGANLARDEDGGPWLAWGSFWGGIKMRRVDPDTGKLSETDQVLHSLAWEMARRGRDA
jgi:arabinan endo-1,5-alpha-L-arabinosidase